MLAGTLLNRYKGLKNKYQSQTQTIKANSRQMDSYLAQIYKKYSIPFACVVFVLIGAPMDDNPKRRIRCSGRYEFRIFFIILGMFDREKLAIESF